jgi:hypothetical protein
MRILNQEKELFGRMGWPEPPEAVRVQTQGGEEFGIRPLTAETLDQVLLPGDIGVYFEPIDKAYTKKPKFLYALAQDGMTHAFVVVNRASFKSVARKATVMTTRETSEKFCHVDLPAKFTGCDWAETTHIFRLVPWNGKEEREMNEAAAELALAAYASPQSITYDPVLYTNLFASRFKDVEKRVLGALTDPKQSVPWLYCSELPFLTHSLARGNTIFEKGESVVELYRASLEYENHPLLARYVSMDLVRAAFKQHILDESTNAIPNETHRKAIARGIETAMGEGLVGKSIRALFDRYYPPVIFPHAFMRAAKGSTTLGPRVRIVYVGTLEKTE